MNIIVLGGINDSKGELNLFTKNRCKLASFLTNEKEKECKIHFSGGVNKNLIVQKLIMLVFVKNIF